MVLLHDIVQVLDLPDDDRRFTSAIDIIHGSFIGSALVHRDLLGSTASLHGFFKEPQGCGLVAPGRQQEVDRLFLLVHRAAQLFPDTLDLDVSLVHAPAAAHRELVLAEHLSAYLEKCRVILNMVDAAESSLFEEKTDLRGRIRLVMPLRFGLQRLMPALL